MLALRKAASRLATARPTWATPRTMRSVTRRSKGTSRGNVESPMTGVTGHSTVAMKLPRRVWPKRHACACSTAAFVARA